MQTPQDFLKGDIVLVSASVYTKKPETSQFPPDSGYKTARIIKWPEVPEEQKDWYLKKKMRRNAEDRFMRKIAYGNPFLAIVVGRSIRQTGVHIYGNWNSIDNPGEFVFQKYHPVVMVTPLENQRYSAPFACLAQDLKIVARYNVQYLNWALSKLEQS